MQAMAGAPSPQTASTGRQSPSVLAKGVFFSNKTVEHLLAGSSAPR